MLILNEIGILYCNGAGASTESVADMALYLIISVFRQMTWSSLAARSNSPTQWQKAHQNVPLSSHNPRGHRLGIVGMGKIGFAIAKKVKVALGMRILYTDIMRKSPAQEAEVDAIFCPTLDDLLPKSDCILIATPHTGQSLLTANTLALLPAGARIVNIARGSLIDENALADALDSDHVAAAGLDVHTHEPNVSERLSRLWNVTLTSHTAGGSVETNIGFERLAMENVELVLSGGAALTPVNSHVLVEKGLWNGVNGVDADHGKSERVGEDQGKKEGFVGVDHVKSEGTDEDHRTSDEIDGVHPKHLNRDMPDDRQPKQARHEKINGLFPDHNDRDTVSDQGTLAAAPAKEHATDDTAPDPSTAVDRA